MSEYFPYKDSNYLRKRGYTVTREGKTYTVVFPGGETRSVDWFGQMNIATEERQREDKEWVFSRERRAYGRPPKFGPVHYEISEHDGKPTAVLYRDGNDGPTDKCPFCGEQHRHGTGDGHRVEHCAHDWTRAFATAEDGTVVAQDRGYIIRRRAVAV